MSAEELNVQLLSQLECPVCSETCKTPIYMCTNGHCVCAKCQPRLYQCSTCRAPGKPSLRCVQLEKFVALLKFPCENKPCALTFYLEDLDEHLPLCKHGFNCLMCTKFKGTVQRLKEHVIKNHPICFRQCSTDGTLSFKSILLLQSRDREWLDLVYFNNDFFWLASQFILATRIFTRTLRIVSNEAKDASRYYYSVEITPNTNITCMHKVLYQADVLMTGDGPMENGRRGDQADVMIKGNGRMEFFLPACFVDLCKSGDLQLDFKIKLKQ